MPDVLPGQGFAPRPPLVTEQQVTPPPPVAWADDEWVPFSVREARLEAARQYSAPAEGPSPMLAPPAYAGGAFVGPTPLADELRRDRELLDAANGRLVRRVRALEAQLRALGVEPVTRE